MPQEMFPSEYNVWPADRRHGAKPAATPIVPAGQLPAGPSTVDLPMPADEANRMRREAAVPSEKVSDVITIYPRGMARDQPIQVPIHSLRELENMSESHLKLTAQQLKDQMLKFGVLPDAPPLLLHSQAPVVITWILKVQVQMARDAGLDVTVASFGGLPHY